MNSLNQSSFSDIELLGEIHSFFGSPGIFYGNDRGAGMLTSFHVLFGKQLETIINMQKSDNIISFSVGRNGF